MKKFISFLICCIVTDVAFSQAQPHLTPPQLEERMAIITNLNHGARLAWRAAVMQKMLGEANYFAEKLKLPTKSPIEITDVQEDYVDMPMFSMVGQSPLFPETIFGSRIYDASIPREQRLRAIEIGASGRIDTKNYEFTFLQGKLAHVMRLDGPEEEYYSRRLGKLVGKPSLIDTNGAYQLATQWLAAVNVDVPALEKQFGHSVNQLQYQPHGATNSVLLPLFYVGLGTNRAPKWKSATFDPAVEVEILGTTKELQFLGINDVSFSHRPLLLITNTMELNHTPDPTPKQLQNPAAMKTFEVTPTEVSNYSSNFPLPTTHTNTP